MFLSFVSCHLHTGFVFIVRSIYVFGSNWQDNYSYNYSLGQVLLSPPANTGAWQTKTNFMITQQTAAGEPDEVMSEEEIAADMDEEEVAADADDVGGARGRRR
jgi:hypothetical protein